MISAGTQSFLRNSCLTLIAVMASLTLLPPVNGQTPAPNPPSSPNQAPPLNQAPQLPDSPNQAKPLDPTDPNVLRPAAQDGNLLSVPQAQRLMAEASSAVSSQNYALAAQKLQEARQIYNQMSNFYQELASSFSGIDNQVTNSQRKKALETAQLRDDATYQLALVHRAENRPELAVPLLVQIIRSQNPTRDLGKKAYQQLFELGFVETPYPRASEESQPTSSKK